MSSVDRERAAKLREAGLGYREIADYLGYGAGTIHRWLNRESAERSREAARRWKDENREYARRYNREYRAEHRRACPNCSTPMADNSVRCGGCRHAIEDARHSAIEGMWADGWSLKEIAATLGTTVNSLGVTIYDMRSGEWDVPYRNRVAGAVA